MDRFYITLRTAYWTIILYCNLNKINSLACNSSHGTSSLMLPQNWPCQWNDGTIPFVFNFYSSSGLKRLISYVRKGHSFLEERSCLVFKEHNPVELARRKSFTYLYYSFSGVLESCCLPLFTKPVGRRLILITPICTLPAEVGHATLHALGLGHPKNEPFPEYLTKELLFFRDHCPAMKRKLDTYEYNRRM